MDSEPKHYQLSYSGPKVQYNLCLQYNEQVVRNSSFSFSVAQASRITSAMGILNKKGLHSFYTFSVIKTFLTRGTHYILQPRRSNDVTILWGYFLHYIIDQFRNTCDNFFTSFRTAIFIPCDKISGKGDVSSASSVGLPRRDFRAVMYYDYSWGKSFEECFQSLKHYFGDQSPSKATFFQVVQTVHVWSENVQRR